jgi:hypothetical protein
MTELLRSVRAVAATTIAVLLLAPVMAGAQDSRSAALAGELATLLDGRNLDAIAAKVGDDQYVGALYFPGSQLLVVAARYLVPERMDLQLTAGNYRDVYIDLNSASVPDSKVFISDLGANGLHARRRDNQFDTVDIGGKSYAFNGDWGGADISEEEYTKTFLTSDAEYAKMLETLLAELKKTS